MEPVKIVAFFKGDMDEVYAVVVKCTKKSQSERNMLTRKLHSIWETDEEKLEVVNLKELGIPCMALHLNRGCGGLNALDTNNNRNIENVTQQVLVTADRKLHWPEIYLNMCGETKETWDRRANPTISRRRNGDSR